MIRVSFLFLSVILFGCGDSNSNSGNDDTTFSFDGQKFVAVEKQSLTTSETKIEGTGSIVANDSLSSVTSGNHFHIEGTLEESSVIALNSNASGSNSDGLVFNFMNTSGSLKVSVEFDGKSVDLSDKFSGKSATSISYRMDVHNDETPAHVLIWDGNTSEFTEENALYNSEDDAATPGNGTGSFWGVVLDNAELTELTVEAPKFEEE